MAIGPDDDGFNPSAFTETLLPGGGRQFAPSEGGALANVQSPLNYFSDTDLIDPATGVMTPEQAKTFEQRNKPKSFDFMSTYGPAIVSGVVGAGVGAASAAAGGAYGTAAGALSATEYQTLVELVGEEAANAAANSAAGFGTGAAAGATAGALGEGSIPDPSAADTVGLTQMGIDAGLTGDALAQFVANGGAADIAGLTAGLPGLDLSSLSSGGGNQLELLNGTGPSGLDPNLEGLGENIGDGTEWGTDETLNHTGDEAANPTNTLNIDPTKVPLSLLQKAINKLSDDPLGTALKAGTLGLGVAGAVGSRNAGNKSAADIRAIGAPQAAIGNQLLQQFQSGTLSPADKNAIDTWERSAISQLRQFYAKAGISSSTQAMHGEQQVRAKAEAMRSQALLSTLTTGLNALGVTDKYQLEAIKAQLAGDQQAMTNASNFLNAFANLSRVSDASVKK